MDKTFQKLRTLNIWAMFLHLVSGILMIILSTDMKVPILSSFLHFDRITQSLVPKMETLLSLPLGPLVASFLLLSAIAHFLIAFPFNKQYNIMMV